MKRIFSFGVAFVLSAAWCQADEFPDIQQIFKTFREQQAFEHRAAEHDTEALQAHLDQIHDLRSTLTLPKDRTTDKGLAETLAKDKEALSRTKERLRLSERAIQGDFLGIPYEMSGLVEKQTGSRWSPISKTTPVLPGEVLRTGPDGRVLLIFEDGGHILMVPNSSFQLKKQSASETTYELIFGSIHVDHRPSAVKNVLRLVEYHTTSAIAIVRGTTFNLSLDEANRTHLVLGSGKIDLSAMATDKKDLSKRGWSRDIPLDTRPLIYGKWVRLALVEGEVFILRPDGIARKAVIGAELAPNERLATGDNGMAWGFMRGDYRVVLEPNSRLSNSKKGNRLSIQLQKGTFHVTTLTQPEEAEARPAFETPTNTCRVSTAEFGVTIDAESGRTDWVPYEGTLEITSH
ncbi:MAG: FecR domain-containing protein [Elusimicrobiota bacterium]|jgi:hypothetical protein